MQAVASNAYSVAAVKLSNWQVSGSVEAARGHVSMPFSSTMKYFAFDGCWGSTVASMVVVEGDTTTRSLGAKTREVMRLTELV